MAQDTFTMADLANFKIGGETVPLGKNREALKAAQVQENTAAARTQAGQNAAAAAKVAAGKAVIETDAVGAEGDADAVGAEGDADAVGAEGDADAVGAEGDADAVEAGGTDTHVPAHMVPKSRLNQVIDERNALRKQNEYLMELAAAQPPAKTDSAAEPAVEAMPTLAALGYDVVKYEAAMTAWTQKQITVAKDQGKQSAAVDAEQARVAEIKSTFESRMTAYAAANPKVVIALGNPHLPVFAQDAAEHIMQSELGPQILHHFGNHPDEAVRIARKKPAEQAAAIGKVEGEINARIKGGKRVSKAPPPPAKINGASTSTVDPSKLSIDDWIAQDRKRDEARRAAKRGR